MTQLAIFKSSTTGVLYILLCLLIHSCLLSVASPDISIFLIVFVLSCGLIFFNLRRLCNIQMLIWEHIPVEGDDIQAFTIKHRDGSIVKYHLFAYRVWEIFGFQVAVHLQLKVTEFIEETPTTSNVSHADVEHNNEILHCYVWSDSIQTLKYRKLLCYLYNY